MTYNSKEVIPREHIVLEDEASSSYDGSEHSGVYEDVAFIRGVDPMAGKDEFWPQEADYG